MAKVILSGLIYLGLACSAFAQGMYPNDRLIVDTEQLEKLLTGGSIFSNDANANVVLIDVRARDDYAKGHIPGAINLPFTDLTDPKGPVEGMLKPDAVLAAMMGQAGITASSRVVLYDDRGGFRAARLFWVLELFGHRDVAILNGGIGQWTRTGGSLETTASVGSGDPADFRIAYAPRRFASADWILEHQHDADNVVIDVRPTKLYDKGHIPWAKSLPWSGNLAEDGTMLSADALTARFASAGVEPGRNVVIHCQTGEASAHSYFALRLLGHPRVRVYHRSWAEWGNADDLPVATKNDS